MTIQHFSPHYNAQCSSNMNLLVARTVFMNRSTSRSPWTIPLLLLAGATDLHAQQPPYDVFPPADPPYYRVRYEAGAQPGELIFPVNYAIWIPPGVKQLRGLIV